MTLTPPPALQISLLLGPRRALRSGLPDRCVHQPQRLFAQGPEISLLEGLLQNFPVVFPCVPSCWDQEAGGQDQVEEIRRALTLPTGHPGSVLGCLQAECSLHRAEVLHFPVSEGWCGCAHLLCVPPLAPTVPIWQANSPVNASICTCIAANHIALLRF